MLFTRCPHCDTIFRVTDEALAKAGGRVRCGRCANVFDATADLRESPDGAAIVRPPTAASAASAASAAGDGSAATPAEERAAPQGPAVAAGVAAAKAADAKDAKGSQHTKVTKDAQSARRPAPPAASAKKPAGKSAASDSTTITPAEIEEVLAGT